MFSVLPALSLLFFQKKNHHFSNFSSEVLLKAGTMYMHIPGKLGQTAWSSPENTKFLWNLLFYIKHENDWFCCFHMHMQVEKLLKVHTFKTFSPLVKFDSQRSSTEFLLWHLMSSDFPLETLMRDWQFAELYHDKIFNYYLGKFYSSLQW